jgi:hypothetical protein
MRLVSGQPYENYGKFQTILKSRSLPCLATETATRVNAIRYLGTKSKKRKDDECEEGGEKTKKEVEKNYRYKVDEVRREIVDK